MLITRSDDERLIARVYGAENEGMVRVLRDMDVLASSLRAALSRLALAEKVVEAARKQVSKSMSVEMALRTYDAALKSVAPKER